MFTYSSTIRPFIFFLLMIAALTGCGNAGAAETPEPAESPGARLRVTNTSDVALEELVVIFPEDRVTFSNVAPGATTEYIVVPHGVYSYAAYEIKVEGETLQQPVMDWMGATPVTSGDFTYVLLVNTDGSGFPVQAELRQD